MAVDLGPLLTIKTPPPQIKPVGITPAVTVGGKIATQTQGRGDGIFRTVVDSFSLLYSTIKGATSAPATAPATAAGMQYGTGNFAETDAAPTVSKSQEALTLVVLAFLAGKFIFKWF